MQSLVHIVLSQLARSPRGRRQLAWLVSAAQGHLGIGTGGDVTSSGEQAIFEQLNNSTKSLDRPVCVFDVGSNQGQFLKLIDQALAKVPHQTHCFEPAPATFAILQKNAGSRSNVVCNSFGLGKVAGEYELFSDTAGSGLASLSPRRLDHFGIKFHRKEKVQVQTLDDYCAQHNIANIDLLKLDVEGHELEVLTGGTKMFAERRIGIVTFEFGGCNIDSRTFFQDFYYFFHAHGMASIFRILPSGPLERIQSYSEDHEQFRTTNFIVLRD